MTTRNNNFDFVRIVAALAVVVSHCFPIHHNVETLWDLGSFAVNTFFAISGYLVMGSWERDPSFIRFAWRRFIRIFPALVVVVLLSTYVIGLSATHIHWPLYIRWSVGYLRTITLFPVRYGLPGVFEGNPLKLVVNGSIWTLPYEVTCYAALAVLGIFGLLRHRAIVRAAWLFSSLWFIYSVRYPEVHFGRYLDDAPQLVVSFTTGMLIWRFRTRIPLVASAMPITIAAILYFRGTTGESYLLAFAVPYAALSIASKSWPGFRGVGRFGDFSYGAYIYAFPIQQWIMHMFPSIDFWSFMAWSLATSIAAGVLSWHFVEKTALRKKDLLGISKREQVLRVHQTNSQTPH